MKIKYNVDLINQNTFKLHSICKQVYYPQTIKELCNLKASSPNIKILGGGSNVILSPVIDNLIMLNDLKYLKRNIKIENNINYSVIVPASKKFIELWSILYSNNIGGLELLYGLPGTIGGAVAMNASSGGCSISDYITYVWAIDNTGHRKKYTKEELQFNRRYSIIQDTSSIITKVQFDFLITPVDSRKVQSAKNHRLKFPNYPSAGGIFKNWHKLKPHINDLVGLSVGDATVSNMVNIIVNKNGATFNDVISLINKIKSRVGENLELEVKII
jgi:UDP-N-acetylmuramate dehydrogenase